MGKLACACTTLDGAHSAPVRARTIRSQVEDTLGLFEESKHPRASNGVFALVRTGANTPAPIRSGGIQWQEGDVVNKTGHLKRSPIAKDTDGILGLQQAVKNRIPKREKGESFPDHRARVKAWAKESVTVESLNAKDLYATQWNINDEPAHKMPLFQALGDDHPVAVELPDGSHHLVDGHHRSDRAAAAGSRIDVKVVRIAGPAELPWKRITKDHRMTKHIHIYLHNQTTDAGFTESDHHRDKGGRFATTGAAGGNSDHHDAKSAHHESEALKKGGQHPDYETHKAASSAHTRAGAALRAAQTQSENGYKPKNLAQAHANKAAEHEAKLSGGKESKVDPDVATSFFEGSHEDFKAAVSKHHPSASFHSTNGEGLEARVGSGAGGHEVVGSIGSHPKAKGGHRGGFRTALRKAQK